VARTNEWLEFASRDRPPAERHATSSFVNAFRAKDMTNRGRLSRVAVAGPAQDRSRKVCHLIDDRLLLFFLRVVLPIITPRIDSEAISAEEATSSQAHGNQIYNEAPGSDGNGGNVATDGNVAMATSDDSEPVTRAMIAAGLSQLPPMDETFAHLVETVEAVYRAMRKWHGRGNTRYERRKQGRARHQRRREFRSAPDSHRPRGYLGGVLWWGVSLGGLQRP
jgi:hypothetical protein